METSTTGGVAEQHEHLQSQIQARQYKKALKTCEGVLRDNGKDVDATAVKVFLLIELSKFEDTLAFLGTQLDGGAAHSFEKAYSLYRLGRFQEAMEAAAAIPDNQAAAKLQLQAQLHYRLSQYSAAIRVYEQLGASHKASALEWGPSMVAAYIAAGRAAELPEALKALKVGPQASFEIAFNYGCALLASGDLGPARQQLLHAQRLGREMLLDDELSEAEIAAELAPVALQLALVDADMGHSEAAEAAFKELAQHQQGLDEEAQAVLHNNSLAVRMMSSAPLPRKALTEARRKAEASFIPTAAKLQLGGKLDQRLSRAQQQDLLANHALLLQATGQRDTSAAMVSALQSRYPGSLRVAVIAASAAVAAGKAERAEQLLAAAPAASSQPEGSAQDAPASWLPLIRAELAARDSNFHKARESLGQLQTSDLADQPGVIASMAAADEACGDMGRAMQAIQAALQQQKQGKGAKGADRTQWLLQRLAGLQLKAGQTGAALATMQQVQSAAGLDSPEALHQLGQLFRAGLQQPSQVDARQLGGLRKHLKPLGALPDAELDVLEAALPGASARRKGAAPMDTDQQGAAKRRRKRKPRLPQGFDPANPGPMPDPERWLPKWQRQGAKRKRLRSKDKDTVKGSQGAGKVDESLDRSKASTDLDAPAAPAKPAPPAQAGKKKKGRR